MMVVYISMSIFNSTRDSVWLTLKGCEKSWFAFNSGAPDGVFLKLDLIELAGDC